MGVYSIPDLTGGMDNALIGLATEVPAFPIMFLVFVWFLIFMGGTTRQSVKKGYADYPMWLVVASLNIFLMSLIMTLKEGLSPVRMMACRRAYL